MRRCRLPWSGSLRRTSCWCRACRRIPRPLQARAHPGRRLRKLAQKALPGSAPPRRRGFARSLRRHGEAEPELLAYHFTRADLRKRPSPAVLATTFLVAQSVPATLHASLMARLDRLGPAAKEIAQIGGDRPRVRLRADRGSGAAIRCRNPFGARSARRGRTVVLPRCRAAILLSLQARPCAGGRLRHLAASEEAGTTRSRRGGAGATFR